jgi:hypothetical protein
MAFVHSIKNEKCRAMLQEDPDDGKYIFERWLVLTTRLSLNPECQLVYGISVVLVCVEQLGCNGAESLDGTPVGLRVSNVEMEEGDCGSV